MFKVVLPLVSELWWQAVLYGMMNWSLRLEMMNDFHCLESVCVIVNRDYVSVTARLKGIGLMNLWEAMHSPGIACSGARPAQVVEIASQDSELSKIELASKGCGPYWLHALSAMGDVVAVVKWHKRFARRVGKQDYCSALSTKRSLGYASI
ncbi:hypothetical protein GOBAR_AA29193 [Gossypium barbadense]|uniref:Uncharacterized protein n=1 Tax=Gossypium barbadense TaxID=3634 RepID=A0A2P5WK94_GOSBA|nr:hypothetical protein GOBAR_AA29193 [Gossypium barbadense]